MKGLSGTKISRTVSLSVLTLLGVLVGVCMPDTSQFIQVVPLSVTDAVPR